MPHRRVGRYCFRAIKGVGFKDVKKMEKNTLAMRNNKRFIYRRRYTKQKIIKNIACRRKIKKPLIARERGRFFFIPVGLVLDSLLKTRKHLCP